MRSIEQISHWYFKDPEDFRMWFARLPHSDKSEVLKALRTRLAEIRENELAIIDDFIAQSRIANINEDEINGLAELAADAIDFWDEERCIIEALLELAEKALNQSGGKAWQNSVK